MTTVLSAIGKFHAFDLARQLDRRNSLKTIFTGYPSFKLSRESLPKEKIKSFPWTFTPYMRFAPRGETLRRAVEWHDKTSFDRYVTRNLTSCDVFCGLSGSVLRSGTLAKSRGARFVCDRGSSHIRFQDRILRDEYNRCGLSWSGIDPRVIEVEEAEYELADIITVPSTFALGTFVEMGVPKKKLRLVPYGVELSTFYPVGQPKDQDFHVLFAGGVSVRKGVSYLLRAFKQLRHPLKHLTIAGSIDPRFHSALEKIESLANVTFLGPVTQSKLRALMSTSHVMVLPSVEEGLALVQAQALACGCPLVSSENTGASDLFTNGTEGFIIPIRDSELIAERLQLLADDPSLRSRMSAAAVERVRLIGGWSQYGETMHAVFEQSLKS